MIQTRPYSAWRGPVERFEKQAIRPNGPIDAQTAQLDRAKRHMFGNPTYQGKSNSLDVEWSILSILADALLIDQRRHKNWVNYDSDQDTR